MALPEIYRKYRQAAIASYDYTDIAEGTGIVAFLGSQSEQTTNSTYLLTTSSHFANDMLTSAALSGSVADAKQMDLDFDVVFNQPQNIRGNAYISATVGCAARNTGTTTIYFIAKLRKWDGTTETEIASAQSQNYAVTNAPAVKTLLCRMPLTATTHFKSGETLRLTMEIWAANTTGAATLVFYHDPAGRDDGTLGTTETSKLTAYIPFRLVL